MGRLVGYYGSMSLASGTRLGPYEVVSPLGAGGMGEVYRARDTRLDRTVAIKVLPAHLASSPELRQRMEREARAISSLNHPHICTLHDIGHQDGVDYLVMEYLEGETLAARLAKGPLEIALAVRYAVQIAEALAQAHRQGIFHRDLKPGNIMLTKTGAKLLDFGLAKLGVGSRVMGGGETTLGADLTKAGTILGTVTYMAPEQLEGRDSDARSDIFSFGAVLYEMITGRKAFEGRSEALVISGIMTSQPPPIATLQPAAPAGLDHVIERCLAKDPEERWQSAQDLAGELKWSLAAPPRPVVPSPPRSVASSRAAWAVAGVLLVALLAVAAVYFRKAPEKARTLRFQVTQPEKMVASWWDYPVVSPDGQRIAFTGGLLGAGDSSLWVRPLNALAAQPLPGTSGARFPFWSPDGRFLAFFANGRLQKLDLSGGPPQTLCALNTDGAGGTWSRQGTILFANYLVGASIRAIAAAGGEPQPVTILDNSRGEQGHFWPRFLPDGRHFVFFVGGSPNVRGLYLGTLDSKDKRRLVATDAAGAYAAPDHLLFPRGSTLLAQPFDLRKLQLAGEPVRAVEQVVILPFSSGAAFSVSENGTLAYLDGEALATSHLVWFDREGKRLGTVGEPAAYTNPSLSPDGSKLAVGRLDVQSKTRDIWVFDLTRGSSTRLTFDPADDMNPLWSPDGRRIAFSSTRKGSRDLYWKASDGAGEEEVLLESKEDESAEDWSRDGKLILFNRLFRNVWVLRLEPERKATPVLEGPFAKTQGQLSPNGRWIAYSSNESGRFEVFVQSFPPGVGKWQISTGGGNEPQWRRDGKELFHTADGKLLAVETKTETAGFKFGMPKVLFETPRLGGAGRNRYLVSPDGRRFLLVVPVEATAARPFTVVVNWAAELGR